MNNTAKKIKPQVLSISEEDYHDLCNTHSGFCIACGEITDSFCEPDARNYTCWNCDKRQVFGIEETLMMGLVELTNDYHE